MDNAPNLFDYATSELSQDAFLAWLIAYADCKYADDDTKAHKIGRKFLDNVLLKVKQRPFKGLLAVNVVRQHFHIDVYATIDELETGLRFVLIVEDKAGMRAHDDQLSRYREAVLNDGVNESQLLLVYCQTYNESESEEVVKSGYIYMGRHALLKVLAEETGNSIIESFRGRLENIETATCEWKSLSPRNEQGRDNWPWLAWQGFFMALREHLEDGSWAYVPNPAGGFLGYWWHWKKISGGAVYLQLEEGKACFKIETGDGFDPNDLKWTWHEKIVAKGLELGVEVIKPQVMRKGTYMTVAILPGDYRVIKMSGKKEIIDFEETIKNLKEMERVVDALES